MARAKQMERIIAKGQLVPLLFTQQNAADGQSAVAMNILEVELATEGLGPLSVTEYNMPFDFEIVAVSVTSNEARTAGTLTADATIDGTVTGLQGVLNATDTTRDYAKQARGLDVGAAGSRVGVKLTTSGWTPTTAHIVVMVWVLVHLDGV